ncbi:MAG: KDO2-lipid IV(A) lauroyltransferase [Halieaceae bacterium]|jgi:KDO2-lipid IV(A) lauroyltransferase
MSFYTLLARLPLRVLYSVAGVIYFLLYYVARYRRRVVRDNLAAAFPQKSPTELLVLEKDFYRQLCDVVVEILHAWKMPAEEIMKRVHVINGEVITELKEKQQSALLLSVHQCNWEWMLHAISLHSGIHVDCVYKPLHNKTADAFIYASRSRFGAKPLAMRDSTKELVRRRSEFKIFAMVADQSPTRKERGYWTDFLNRPAAFYEGAEKIALLTQNPVIFVHMRRVRRGHYELRYEPLAEPPHEKNNAGITEAYIEAAERSIRSQPESWLWSNRRWKRSPEATDAVNVSA